MRDSTNHNISTMTNIVVMINFTPSLFLSVFVTANISTARYSCVFPPETQMFYNILGILLFSLYRKDRRSYANDRYDSSFVCSFVCKTLLFEKGIGKTYYKRLFPISYDILVVSWHLLLPGLEESASSRVSGASGSCATTASSSSYTQSVINKPYQCAES